MRLGRLARSAIVLVPLMIICAGRLHAQRGASPGGMTQEVNRCLTVIRVAASRRKARGRGDRERFVRVRTDAEAGLAPPVDRAKSA